MTPTSEGRSLRELLWRHHGCPSFALYGEDRGEMHCQICQVDFCNDDIEDIATAFAWRANRQIVNFFRSETLCPSTT